jgi:AraC-like DNA-binding protein
LDDQLYKELMTHPSKQFSTVSGHFVSDWLTALKPLCSDAHFRSLLQRANLLHDSGQLRDRITLDQIVCLYQLAAVETGDEMMGLWSRPIRPRALQHLIATISHAASLTSALYRFSTFWNLLLDAHQFVLIKDVDTVTLTLEPLDQRPAQRFGHMLILKLAHGLTSWLAGREIPVKRVSFGFAPPVFEDDYAVIFPAPVDFDRVATSITFDRGVLGKIHVQSSTDHSGFLENAPRDWIFTRSHEHTQSLRVRNYIMQSGWDHATLEDASSAMNMTSRTLIRRLAQDGTSFQAIKDALRRDIAIGHLQAGNKSIDTIAHEIGFSSGASFHKAFQRWTGNRPSSYRHQPSAH